MPFQKGQSGNPGGKPKQKDWAAALRISVSETKGDKTKLRHIAEKVVELAIEGEMAAVKEIGDRLDGKPAQSVEGTGNEGEFLLRLLKHDEDL